MKRTPYIFIFLFCFSLNAFGQCNLAASFNYLQGANGVVTFTSIVNGGTAPYNCNWIFTNDSIAPVSGANAVFTFPANYTYVVCLQVSDSKGCYTDSCIPITVTTAQTYNCPGAASFTVIPNGINTDFSFAQTSSFYRDINFGDGTSSSFINSNLVTHSYVVNGNYTVKCRTFYWLNNFAIYCDTFLTVVTVSNVPCHADFTEQSLVADSISLYHGFYLANLSTGYLNTKWLINGNIIAANANTFYTSNFPPGTYNICLVMSGPNGCSDSICKIDSLVYPPVCSGVSFSYLAVSSPCDTYQFTTTNAGAPLTSVEWDEDGSMVSAQQNPVLTLSFASAQNNIIEHAISVTAKGSGCESSSSFQFYNPASFTVNIKDSTNNPHVWQVYPSSFNATSETWDFGDGTTSNQPYPTHIYASAGTYNLCHQVTLTNGCSYNYCYSQYFFREEQGNAVVEIIVLSPTSVKTVNDNELQVHFYPNPVSNIFYAETKQAIFNSNLTIFNSIGQPLKTVLVNEKGTLFTADIKQFPSGIYFFRIVGTGIVNCIGKFIVVK